MKAIIYARVSSKDQEAEGFSIPSQLKLLKDYAYKNNFKIVQEYTDVETAKRAGRTQFTKMIKTFSESSDIKHILVEKTDRLLRNITDYASIDNLMENCGISIHLVKENVVLGKESKSNEKFIFGIKALVSKNYVDNLSEEVKKGMLEKAEQGIYPSVAPFGYLNVREDDKRSVIKIDSKSAFYVKRMFELYGSGTYSLKDVCKLLLDEGMVYKNGKRFNRSTLEAILKNEFYTGVFYWNGKKYEDASHESIVSKELFQRVQDCRHPNKTKSKKEMFTYSGFIKCGICGCSLTAEIKKQKYIYYHCTGFKGNCRQGYVRQESLDEQFENLLSQIHITDDIQKIILDGLKESLKEKIEYHNNLVDGFEKQIKLLQKRVDQAYIDKLDGKIREEFWQTHTRKWMSEKETLSLKLVSAQRADTHYLENAQFILELSKNASEWFKTGSWDKKRKVLEILLSNCTYKDKNLDVELKSVFGFILKSSKTKDWWAVLESNQ